MKHHDQVADAFGSTAAAYLTSPTHATGADLRTLAESIAATPDATTLVTETDLTGPMAIAVGAEQAGLPPDWLDSASVRVRIPMFGKADSLNVSTSAAILTYEAVRQRLQAGELANRPPIRSSYA